MQLILHSEANLAIERDMATVDSIQTEKIANGGIEELNEKNGIGNKENIEDLNSINNDKQIINEDGAPAEVLTDKNIENNLEDKANAVDTVKEEDTIKNISVDTDKEEICDESSPKKEGDDCAQIEDSQRNGAEEIDGIDITKTEAENKTYEKSGDIRKDEEDIIRIKEETIIEIGTAEKELENTIAINDEIAVKEELPVTKEEDIEVIEEETEVSTPCEIATDADLVKKTKEEMKETDTSSKNKDLDGSKNVSDVSVCDVSETVSGNNIQDTAPIELKDDMDEEELAKEKKNIKQDAVTATKDSKTTPVNNIIDKPILCKLSNTLDILSDDEEEPPKEEAPVAVEPNEKQCINIDDDDDIMLIDEDTNKTETQPTQPVDCNKETPMNIEVQTDSETGEKTVDETSDLFAKTEEKESTPPADINGTKPDISINEKEEEKDVQIRNTPLLPDHFLKTAKKNLSDMTREDLEEFCILKIVESIVDRSNLSEIKNKLKTMAQGIEEYRKKAMMLTKQNRDLQVVLKSVQEEQKNMTPGTAITPLKITRSVGMQVFMEKTGARRKSLAQLQTQQTVANPNSPINRQNTRNASTPSPRPQKPLATSTNQPIPVPRLVPANSPAIKTPSTIPLLNQITPTKTASPIPNGIKNPSPVQKVAEKRQHNRIISVTVDLTDDEPPTKINNRTSPAPPVRLVPPQNLMANPRQPFGSSGSSPRKVYIPISGPQNQGIRPGQTIMLKPANPGLKPRVPMPPVARAAGPVRVNRMQPARHPAPLPDAMKQYQPPNWKALPPAPDLKLSKVENGIVISWKIEGYQEDSYEEIASYQLYAYQETSSPASTALWKKIGDVKALPLPMACTLTQFMAGFKYYFAVRAVDIRSRLGPFSLPGSILLLNKL